MAIEREHWDIEIAPPKSEFSLNLKEVWRYRDLMQMYIKRDIVTMYKQTVLGPLWFIIQPLFMTLTMVLVFGNIAKVSTDGLPQILFYFSGNMAWSYFSECLGRSSGTFLGNVGVFSKVYFPRLVVPLAGSVSALMRFGIQVLLFFAIYLYFYFNGVNVQPNIYALLFPVIIVMLAGLGIGFGLIVSSITTKYRDMALLFGFFTQLWMYASPVIYPLSSIPDKYRWLAEINPLTSVIEAMKYGLMGQGTFSWYSLGYSFLIMIVVLIVGIWRFNQTERNFVDVV